MLTNYLPVVFLLAIGVLIGVSVQVVGLLVRPDRPGPAKLVPYECGIEPTGDTFSRNAISYYIFGLLFLLFDVEVLFFFLWAVIYQDMMLLAFLEITFFAFILFLGLIYAWLKGALDWAPNNM
jgi:NADH-quinone oxidoreductase subunit A